MKKIITLILLTLTVNIFAQSGASTAKLQSAGNATAVASYTTEKAIYSNDTLQDLIVVKTVSFTSLNNGTLNVAFDALNGCASICNTYSFDIGYDNMELFYAQVVTDGNMNTILVTLLDSTYQMSKDGDAVGLNVSGQRRIQTTLTSGGTGYLWIYGPPRTYEMHPYYGTFYPTETGIPFSSRYVYVYPYVVTPYTPSANQKYYFIFKFRKRK